MKIVYLNIGNNKPGVIKKLRDKLAGIDRYEDIESKLVHVLMNTDPLDANTIIIESNLMITFSRLPFLWRLTIPFQQYLLYKTLRNFLKTQEFDLIVMRYPFTDYFHWRFMKSFKRKVVFEHNTLELEELRVRKGSSSWYGYFLWNEKIFGQSVRRLACGLVAVTEEIADRQRVLVKNKVPTFVISNGIDVERVPERIGGNFERGNVLRMLFLAGSDAPWHGLDILLNAMEMSAYPTHCTIAGNISKDNLKRISNMSNITFYNLLAGETLDEIVNSCHIGVGSLALFRNHMEEACTLKVREYWSRGLPFILGYKDTDLVENEAMKTFFKRVNINRLTNTFEMNDVVEFGHAVYQSDNLHSRLRSAAISCIDYRIKSAQYVRSLTSMPE